MKILLIQNITLWNEILVTSLVQTFDQDSEAYCHFGINMNVSVW